MVVFDFFSHSTARFMSENFQPGCRAPFDRRNRDLGRRAGPPSHMKTLIFLHRGSLRSKRLSNIGRAVLGNAGGASSTREGKITQARATQAHTEGK